MKHLGDITKISGYTAPVVDCIIGGSPCQDLSVAGKRAGLDGERSGLYIEQVRIVKEMRERDERNGRSGVDIRPRYMVWENVPGAFSSNKGEDFRIVLEELAKVKDKDAVIPMPEKLTNCGCIMGDGWSIAWRVFDAQFWGVPQRRRRIALVADFGGESAPEILFVRKSVSRDIEPSKSKRKETPSDASRSFGADDSIGVDVFNGNLTSDKVISLVATGNNSTGYSPKVMTPLGADQYNAVILGDTVSTLGVNCGMSHGRQCILEPKEAICFEPGIASREGGHIYEGVSGTLRANAGDNQMATAYGISSYNSNAMKSSNPHSGIYEADTSRTLDGNGGNPSCNQGGIAIVEPVPYTLKIRGGVSVDSMGKAAGKGALIQEDLSATLGVSQDQYLFQPVFSVENHPNDSRVGINEDGKVQALTSRMGTGGGNVPMVMQCYSKSKRAQSATDNETWVESDTANTLNAFDVGDVRTTEAVVYALDRASFNQGKNGHGFEISDTGVASPLLAVGPSAVCHKVVAMEAYQHHGYRESDVLGTLTAGQNGGVRGDTPLVCETVAYCIGNGQAHDAQRPDKELCKTLNCMDDPMKICVAVDCRNGTEDSVNGALQSNSAHSLNGNNVVRTRYIVRRLTPLECERLQGYPDGWTDIGEWTDTNGKKRQTSDASRYKALGNSISLPNWKWVLKRICACYERDATMASLFDGIGGFPYLWEQLNGKWTCLWASEIEEFPIAVTKVRIGE